MVINTSSWMYSGPWHDMHMTLYLRSCSVDWFLAYG